MVYLLSMSNSGFLLGPVMHGKCGGYMNGNRYLSLPTTIVALLFLTSCSLAGNWRDDQSVGLGPSEHMLWLPYENRPNLASAFPAEFPLRYFTKEPFDPRKPSILYCPGGPGEIVETVLIICKTWPRPITWCLFIFAAQVLASCRRRTAMMPFSGHSMQWKTSSESARTLGLIDGRR